VIIVNCRDVESIKNELLVYVSDQVGAIPTIKQHEFALSSIDEGQRIDQTRVISAIKEFLNSIGEERNFGVISNENVITIKSLFGKTIQREQQTSDHLFTCTHCGHVTQYEVVHNNHVKIHYL